MAPYPFFTAEMAGGMELAYHRRPLMAADDIAALDIAKLGSGVTLYGNYMFHGGTNPEGKLTTLQESQATGYPQDLPQKSCDFQATPLGEYGQMHPSFRDLKSIHLFLHDFGPDLAPMSAYFPSKMPTSKQDRETPRVAIRSDSHSGYIFLNNYQKDHPLPDQKNLQVGGVKLASGTTKVPRRPVDIPSGAYTFWPVNLPVGGSLLEYATAEPLCKLDDPDTLLFFAWPGITPEFVFEESAKASIDAPGGHITHKGNKVVIDGLTPGLAPAIEIHGKDGHRTQILLLSREQAHNVWKASVAATRTPGLLARRCVLRGRPIALRAPLDPAKLHFGTLPRSGAHKSAGFQRSPDPKRIFSRVTRRRWSLCMLAADVRQGYARPAKSARSKWGRKSRPRRRNRHLPARRCGPFTFRM